MEHAASTHPWLVALEGSGLGQAMRQSALLYPLVEVLHILGFIALVGGIAAFDLRVLGLGRGFDGAVLARVAVPLSGGGLILALAMGSLLFATEATHVAVNAAFQVKLACIAVGLVNAALFHVGPWRDLDNWTEANAEPPLAAKAGAVVSLLAWTGAVVAGRLIAYL